MPAAEKDVLLAVSVSFLLVLLALASSSLITPEWPHAHIKMHINIIRTQLLTVILAQLLIYIYIYIISSAYLSGSNMARMGYFTHPDIQGRLNYPPGGLLEACCFVMLPSYYVLHFYMYTAVAGHLALSTQLVKTFILHTYLALPPSLSLSPFHRSCCPSLK